MNKIIKKWAALLLAVTLTTTTVYTENFTEVQAAAFATENETLSADNTEDNHVDIDYADMKYEKYNPKKFNTLIKKGEKLCKSSGNEEELFAIYDNILDEFDIMYTSMQLNDINYYKDNTNEYYVEQQTYCQELSETMNDQTATLVRDIIDSEYKDAFEEKVGSKVIEDYKDYEPLTDKQKKITKKERKLVQEYDSVIMKTYSVTVDGTKWTEDELNNDETLSYEEYVDIYTQLQEKKNAAAGKVFVQLVKVRTQLAKTYGYDNYADFAYEKGYDRDYTTEDTKELYEYVREYLAPISLQLQMTWTSEDQQALQNTGFTEEEIINYLGTYVKETSEELIPAYDYMTQHHLYDISDEDTKMEIGYTTELSKYNAPFIFYKPYGNYWDMKTLIHEFGHYNNFYQTNESAFYDGTSLDLAEVHSQGLEMLFLDYYDKIYGENADTIEKIQFIDMLGSVIDGCIYDEFQVEVYKNPDMSLKEMNQLMRTIEDSYNYPYYDNSDESYGWVDVSHTFQSPLYYISYATSALGAFDIWKLSLEDRDQAIETYLSLAKADGNVEFRKGLEENGLQDIFSEEYIKELASALEEKCFGTESGDEDSTEETVETVENMQNNQSPQKKDGYLIAGITIGIIVLLIVILVIVQRRRNTMDE